VQRTLPATAVRASPQRFMTSHTGCATSTVPSTRSVTRTLTTSSRKRSYALFVSTGIATDELELGIVTVDHGEPCVGHCPFASRSTMKSCDRSNDYVTWLDFANLATFRFRALCCTLFSLVEQSMMGLV